MRCAVTRATKRQTYREEHDDIGDSIIEAEQDLATFTESKKVAAARLKELKSQKKELSRVPRHSTSGRTAHISDSTKPLFTFTEQDLAKIFGAMLSYNEPMLLVDPGFLNLFDFSAFETPITTRNSSEESQTFLLPADPLAPPPEWPILPPCRHYPCRPNRTRSRRPFPNLHKTSSPHRALVVLHCPIPAAPPPSAFIPILPLPPIVLAFLALSASASTFSPSPPSAPAILLLLFLLPLSLLSMRGPLPSLPCPSPVLQRPTPGVLPSTFIPSSLRPIVFVGVSPFLLLHPLPLAPPFLACP
ncbi:hypothetical protein DFH09DRAFT_1309754 [Mycena vulgaris]|nr:hypothetical protein DFH09DRAFT_1309754 [Mycena vulgaris]